MLRHCEAIQRIAEAIHKLKQNLHAVIARALQKPEAIKSREYKKITESMTQK